MNKSTILLGAVTALILTGCTSKMNYKSDKMIDSSKKYNIEIRMKKTIEPGFFVTDVTNKVTLYINDEIVLKGNLDRDESGELQGIYNNEKLNLACSKDSIFSPSFCTVHLGKKRIGESKLEIYQR
ncbi:MAG: hypothetical protein GX807_02145 [Erysipelotrichia bacterium]|nr:hypothetical protein [Erysipelotrichia bacterium]